MPRRYHLYWLIPAFLLLLPAMQVAVWDGQFDLTVTLQNPTGKAIRQLEFETLSDPKIAPLLMTKAALAELDLKPVAWTPGKPFTVPVRCSGRRNMFGEHAYYQFKLLFLKIQYDDATTEYVPAEIPDGRKRRYLSISSENSLSQSKQ